MVAFSQVKPNTIKLRVLPQWSNLAAGAGIAIASASGRKTVSVSFADMDKITSVPGGDLSNIYIGAWDDLNGIFQLYSITEIQGLQGDPGPASPTDFGTVALVQGASVSLLVDHIRTAGYYAQGDGGGALYKRVVSEPATGGKIQSSDGAWWSLSEPRPNILQFGAKGDNLTVNTTSIQTALDSGADAIYVPDGTFLTNRLIVPVGVVLIHGTGTLKATGTIAAFADFIDVTSNLNLTIRDISINVNAATYASNGSIALLGSCASILIQNVKFLQSGRFGVQIIGGASITIENCDFQNFSQSAVSAVTGTRYLNILNNRITGPATVAGANIDIQDCFDVTVSENFSFTSSSWHISYQNVGGGRVVSNQVYNSTAESMVVGAGSTDIEIAFNICHWTVAGIDFGMSFGGTDPAKITYRLHVHDNLIMGSYKTGIAFADYIQDSVIRDNQIDDCNTGNLSVNGNGIELYSSLGSDICIRNLVCGNVVKNSPTGKMKYGAKEYTGANFNQVTGNFFRSLVTANVDLVGGSSAQSTNVTLP